MFNPFDTAQQQAPPPQHPPPPQQPQQGDHLMFAQPQQSQQHHPQGGDIPHSDLLALYRQPPPIDNSNPFAAFMQPQQPQQFAQQPYYGGYPSQPPQQQCKQFLISRPSLSMLESVFSFFFALAFLFIIRVCICCFFSWFCSTLLWLFIFIILRYDGTSYDINQRLQGFVLIQNIEVKSCDHFWGFRGISLVFCQSTREVSML